jgi:hypothetical protein
MLVAYRDTQLSPEAADQLVRMLEDPNCPKHAGEDLPKADPEALLEKIRSKSR